MTRALAVLVACFAFGCTAASLEHVRREHCETGTAPPFDHLPRGDACAVLALDEGGSGPERMRHLLLGCENGSPLACHYALEAVPEARSAFLEGPGGAAEGAAGASLSDTELVALREAAESICLERSPALRVCIGAAMLYARVEPRQPARATALLAHRCRASGDCAMYRLGHADGDGDTILDREDRCPDIPEDLDGNRDQDGCPDIDEDGDGLRDDEDLCPDAPEDFDSFEDADGCPDPDDDDDGILDADDACPREAETRNGSRDDDGCPDIAPACSCRYELAASREPPACAQGASDTCSFAMIRREAEALLCIERTDECPSTALTASPDAPIREIMLRAQTTQLAVSARLRARPSGARALRAYGGALERQIESLALAALRLGRAGSSAFSEEEVRDALTRAEEAQELVVRTFARLAPEDREAITSTTDPPTR